MGTSKRTVVGLILTTCCLSVAACGGSSGGQASGTSPSTSSAVSGSLTFVNYGGDGMKAAQQGWLAPYTAKTGVTFKTDQPSDPAKAKAMVQAGNPTWDVIDMDPTVGGNECGTTYEKRPAGFDTSQLQQQGITDDCMVPIIGQVVALVYNKKLFGDDPPTSITDFTNTTKYPGKRITFNWYSGSMEPLSMAAGIPADQVVPFQWDKVQAMVDSLGKDMVFQDTLDAQVQSQESGDFAMCLCYTGRSALAQEDGADIGIVWSSVWVGFDGLYVLKGTHNPDAAWNFSQYLATSEGQNGFYKYLPYSPMTTGAPPDVQDSFKEWMLSFNQDKIQQQANFDVKWQADNATELADKWTAMTSG